MSPEVGVHREIVITRVFDTPRDLVFKAWTDPDHLKRWWGPKVFTTPYCTVDLRVGGLFRYCMRSPDGQDFWGRGIFREIVPPQRLVYVDEFTDADGNPVPASHYGMEGDWPPETLVTVTFEAEDGRTRMTLRHAGMPAGTHGEMAQAGWTESIDRLEAMLAQPEA